MSKGFDKSLAKQITSFEKLQGATSKTKQQFIKLTQSVREQDAAMKAATKAVRDQEKALQRANAQRARATQQVETETAVLRSQIAMIKQGVKAEEALTRAKLQSKGASQAAVDGLIRQRQELNRLVDTGKRAANGGPFATIGKSLRSIFNFTVGFGLFSAFAQLQRGLFDTAQQVDRLNVALETASGSSALVGLQFERLRRRSNQLAVPIFESIKGFADFKIAASATSLSAQEVEDSFNNLQTAMAGAQLPAEQSVGVMRALVQIMSKGKLQAEELRGQLGDRLPGAFNFAAEAMGVTTGELDRMLKAGEVLSEEFIPKFTKRIAEFYEAAAAERANTVGGAVQSLSNAFVNLGIALNDAGLRQAIIGTFGSLSNVINSIAENLDTTLTIMKLLAAFAAGSFAASLLKASAAASALAKSLTVLRGAASLFGGLPGILLGGAAALVTFAATADTNIDKANELTQSVQELVKANKALAGQDLSRADVIEQYELNRKKADELRTAIAKLEEQRMRELGQVGEIENLRETNELLADKRSELNALQNSYAGLAEQIRSLPKDTSVSDALLPVGIRAAAGGGGGFSVVPEGSFPGVDKPLAEGYVKLLEEYAQTLAEAKDQTGELAVANQVLAKIQKEGLSLTEAQKEELIDLALATHRYKQAQQEQAKAERDAEQARKRAQREAEKSEKRRLDNQRKATEEAVRLHQEAAEEQARAYERAAERIENAFSDLLRKLFTDFGGITDFVVGSVRELAINSIVTGASTGTFPSIFSTGSQVGMLETGVEFLGNKLEDIGIKFGIESAESMGSTLLMNAGMIGNAIGVAAAGYALFQTGKLLTAEGSQFSGDTQGGAALATMGLSTVASGIDKAFGGNIFGTRYRTAAQTLTVSLGEGILDATIETIRKKKGSLFSGGKVKKLTDAASGIDAALATAFEPILDVVDKASTVFGSDLASFEFATDVDIKGKTEEEIKQLLSEVIADASDAVALQVLPGIESFRRAGEELIDTLARVTGTVEAFTRASERVTLAQPGAAPALPGILGGLIPQSILNSINENLSSTAFTAFADNLVEAVGGVQAFNQAIDTLISFAPEAEQTSILWGDLGYAIGDLRDTLPSTKEGFYALFGTLGPSAQETLLSNIGLIEDYYSNQEKAAEETKRAADALDDFVSRVEDLRTSLNRQITGLAGGSLALFDINAVMGALGAATDADTILGLLPQLQQALTARYEEGVSLIEKQRDEALKNEELRLEALDKEADSLQELVDNSERLRDLARSLREYAISLRFGPAAPGTPIQQLNAAQQEFFRQANLARGGDVEAAGGLQSLAQTVITQARGVYASGTAFQSIFRTVESTLNAVADAIDITPVTQEQRLKEIAEEVKALQDGTDARLEQINSTFDSQINAMKNDLIVQLQSIEGVLDDLIAIANAPVGANVDSLIEALKTEIAVAIDAETTVDFLLGDNTLPADLVDLAVGGNRLIQAAVNALLDPASDPAITDLLVDKSTDFLANISAVGGDLTDEQEALLFGTSRQIDRILNVSDNGLTNRQYDLLYAYSRYVDRILNAEDTGLNPQERDILYAQSERIDRELDAYIGGSGVTNDEMAIINAATGPSTVGVDVAIDPSDELANPIKDTDKQTAGIANNIKQMADHIYQAVYWNVANVSAANSTLGSHPDMTQSVPAKGSSSPGGGYVSYTGYAMGGIATTASIFGEAGPEAAVPLPDGRTIPVTLSGGMDTKAIVAELRMLRQELALLQEISGVTAENTGMTVDKIQEHTAVTKRMNRRVTDTKRVA